MLTLKKGVVVPTPREPTKKDVADVVEIKLPTVSCVPVATRPEPVELETSIEFPERLTARARVPLVVTGLPETAKPAGTDRSTDVTVPWFCARQVPLIAKHPVEMFSPTLDVVVAVAEMLSPLSVVVPVDDISRAEMEVVA